MISRYRDFLSDLDAKLLTLFEAQTPFIKCKKGCAYCCKEGEFQISELEYINMMLFYNNLDDSVKSQIDSNIAELLSKPNEKFYICPFLINNICMIYPARSIICRTFGLISFYKKENKRIPFCVDLDLNYSNVYDKNLLRTANDISNGFEPIAYNIDRRVLRNKAVEKKYDIYFGEDKPMRNWLQEDFV